jgi:hypothetical protein
MPPLRPQIRELAERSSSAARVRLLWRRGTTLLWVEVSSPHTDQALAIPVPPEHALDAFHHPWAYAGRTVGHFRPSRSSAPAHPCTKRPRETRE